MNKELQRLEYELSILEMKDHWSHEDFIKSEELNKKIDELSSQITSGVALKITNNKYGFSYYLSSDSEFCCSNSPVWFDNEEEVMEYFNKAHLNHKEVSYEVLYLR